MVLFACGAAPVAAPRTPPVTVATEIGGSVRLADDTPPTTDPGWFVFSGSINGTNRVSRQACESSGGSYRHFTLTTDGNVAGRAYFLSISIYPYRGPGVYELQPLPGESLSHDASPNPFLKQAPKGYPGYLNFVPKRPGNAYVSAARPVYSRMAVDAGEGAGWLDGQMFGLDPGGARLQMSVGGRFVCGPAFTPYPEI
jgi:hypothetical protein